MNAHQQLMRLKWAMWALHISLAAGLFALIARSASLSHLLLATLAVLPLLLPLIGLLRARAYTASWASMLVSFYCALLLSEAYMLPALKLPLVLLATVAALDFVALMLFAKGQKAATKALAAQTGS